ncbi:MAG TPA: glutathione S-transferase N-terminal domain-containing protein [Gammaproteobacteria bacterium]|nr:glutathione S-transferase N-terminal domain-containing protein [Gammaproteobacteria bacterium]
MAQSAARRPVMTLYSGMDCLYSHRTRMALAEKNIAVDVVYVDLDHLPEDLIDLNPYHTIPVLVDRDLVLYNDQIIMEYLDERYPHPPLMPVDPVSRARTRLMLYRIDRDWFSAVDDITSGDDKRAARARKVIRDGMTSISSLFAKKPYFMSDEITLTDCCLAALLWRLPAFGIELPAQAKPILKYADRMFARESFQASLTKSEQEMQGQ